MQMSAFLDKFVGLVLASYFLSRVVLSALKLSERDIGTSTTTVIKNEILYPSVSMCYRMHAKFNHALDPDRAMRDASRDISELVMRLRFTQVSENGQLVVTDLSGSDLLAFSGIHAYTVWRVHRITKPGDILDCFTFDPPGPTLPGMNQGVSELKIYVIVTM